MAKQFVYNPDTLSYEALHIPLKVYVGRFLLVLAVGIALSTAATYVFSYFFGTPRTVLLRKANDDMLFKLDLLLYDLNQTNDALNNLAQRDDKVYRAIFGADPVPLAVRESGMGMSGSYEQLLANQGTVLLAEAMMLMDKTTKKAYIQSISFDEIAEYAQEKEQMMLCIPYISPVNISDNKVNFKTSSYGWRNDPFLHTLRFHKGLDFGCPVGTPIYATGNGKVEAAGFNLGGFGDMVLVNHGFGYHSRYAHLSEIKVRVGDKVQRGQVVGLSGNSGHSKGPHLHYEVLLKNNAVDPINFFNEDVGKEYDKIIDALMENSGNAIMEY
ncbi:MAG: M23 family metallopeptidase [Prevotellaceae bacterium]|nr:M23 family metallopeptidase [Prevotellaceae bacterium]